MKNSGNERRTLPRYPVDLRIVASIDGQPVPLRNIGEAGIALQAPGLEAGSWCMLEINPDQQHMTSVLLQGQQADTQ
jgi:hypothetical protein